MALNLFDELRTLLSSLDEQDVEYALVGALALAMHGLEPVWESRQELHSELGSMWVISRDALIRMKTWAGRERDIADIRRLEDLDR